jgi:phytoene/squalene synthetase
VVPKVTFAIKRLWLPVEGALVDRDKPNLRRLDSMEESEQFVWAMLPHAARSFAPSILLLPEHQARLAAVGYLYARMLDTYEDLSPNPEEARRAIESFARRFSLSEPGPAPDISESAAADVRDRAHVLLVRRHYLVDEVFSGLDAVGRKQIIRMVREMARGMVEFSEIFEEQGGVLDTEQQVIAYCHHVIGVPATFTLDLMLEGAGEDHQDQTMRVSELIQLANITRDVEKDLSRGIAYHPLLRSHIGNVEPGEADEDTATARRELMLMATRRAGSFRRLLEAVDLPRLSPARSAAVLMMLFTDRHFRRCAVAAGLPSWSGPSRVGSIILTAVPAAFSGWWANRILLRVERDLLATSSGQMVS